MSVPSPSPESMSPPHPAGLLCRRSLFSQRRPRRLSRNARLAEVRLCGGGDGAEATAESQRRTGTPHVHRCLRPAGLPAAEVSLRLRGRQRCQRYSKRGRASEKQEELKAGHTWLFPLWLEAHETAGTEAGGGDRKWRWPTPAAALPALIKFLSEVFQQEMVL